MGAFGTDSKSSSSSDSSRQTGQAGDSSIVQVRNTKGKGSVAGDKWVIGRGATVTFSNTDGGAIEAAQKSIERIVNAQADNTAAALGALGRLGETTATGGDNLKEKSNRWIYAAFALVALVAIWKLAKR